MIGVTTDSKNATFSFTAPLENKAMVICAPDDDYPYVIIQRLRKAAHPNADTRDIEHGPSDFFQLLEAFPQDYDNFCSEVQHTREYCFFILATICHSPDLTQPRQEVFRQIRQCFRPDLTSPKSKSPELLQEAKTRVSGDPLLFDRAEMIARILANVCWQLIKNCKVFLIPMCEDREALGELKQRVDDAFSNGLKYRPILVDFCHILFTAGSAARWQTNRQYMLPSEEKEKRFGWEAGLSRNWAWSGLLEEDGSDVRYDLEGDDNDDKKLVSFASYYEFFMKRRCQVVGAYKADTAGHYNYLSENGRTPIRPVAQFPSWEWAKNRYQYDFGRKRPAESGCERPPYYLTISFSVHPGDVAGAFEKGIPVRIYAVYSILDLLHIPGRDDPPLHEITDTLHNNIEDLRSVARETVTARAEGWEDRPRVEFRKRYRCFEDSVIQNGSWPNHPFPRLFQTDTEYHGLPNWEGHLNIDRTLAAKLCDQIVTLCEPLAGSTRRRVINAPVAPVCEFWPLAVAKGVKDGGRIAVRFIEWLLESNCKGSGWRMALRLPFDDNVPDVLFAFCSLRESARTKRFDVSLELHGPKLSVVFWATTESNDIARTICEELNMDPDHRARRADRRGEPGMATAARHTLSKNFPGQFVAAAHGCEVRIAGELNCEELI
jgi:hypothetical protein